MEVSLTKSQLDTIQKIALQVSALKGIAVDSVIFSVVSGFGVWFLMTLQKTNGDFGKTVSKMAQQTVGVLSEAVIEIIGDIFEQIFHIFYKGGKKLGKKVDKAFKEAGKDIKKSTKKTGKQFDKFGKDFADLFK